MGGDLNLTRDFMRALPALAEGGRVYAITSGRTFSAAISSLGYLKQAAGDRLTIVGEPIGDRLEFWAEGNILQLPGLGALMLYADERHNYMTGCPEADCHRSIRDHPIRVRSLQPDIAAPLALRRFRRRPRPGDGGDREGYRRPPLVGMEDTVEAALHRRIAPITSIITGWGHSRRQRSAASASRPVGASPGSRAIRPGSGT